MAYQEIESEEYLIRIHDDNLMECKIKEGVAIDTEFLLKGKKMLEELLPGNKYYLLSEGIGFFSITQEAREMIASPEYSSHLRAVAFYTTNYSLKLLADMYNKINKPVVLTRVFTDRESAMEWLKALIESSNGQVQNNVS
jgi:hypothetical protein